jgi:hypothetical protein
MIKRLFVSIIVDLGETSNLITKYPDRAKEMAARLRQIRQNNRSRP